MVVKSSVNKYLDVNKFWKAAEGKARVRPVRESSKSIIRGLYGLDRSCEIANVNCNRPIARPPTHHHLCLAVCRTQWARQLGSIDDY